MRGVGVEDWGWGNWGWPFSQTRVTPTSNRAPVQREIFIPFLAVALMDSAGKASYVVYDEEDIDDDLLKLVCARKYNEPLVIARTERFIIREVTVGDLPHLYELYQTLSDCPYVEPLYEYEDEVLAINYDENTKIGKIIIF